MHSRFILGWVYLLGLIPSALVASEAVITVSGGSLMRRESVASAVLPEDLRSAHWLIAPRGVRIPLQVDAEGRGWFVVTDLPAGSNRTYRVDDRRKSSRRAPPCELTFDEGALRFSVQGHPVLQYHQMPSELPRSDIKPIFRRGGYFHPIFSPSGLQVTDDYATNHLHHHGIWSAWTKTTFEGRHPDFWNMGDGKGTVVPLVLGASWDGPVQAGFQSRHRYYDLTTTPRRLALEESWEGRVYAVGGRAPRYHLFDLNLRQTCTSASSLELPLYHYGGLGFRGNEAWNDSSNIFFLTSEGETNRIRAHATRARWCYVGGRVQGKLTGIALLCHVTNFRAPQPMRVHPTEPFFCYAPQQAGDFQITPQLPYSARYRFVVFDGPPDPQQLNLLWEDYAHPVEAAVTSPPDQRK